MHDRSVPAAFEQVPKVAWLGLAILMVFYLLSFLDKQMLSLLANPIGVSLKLSDTQIGNPISTATVDRKTAPKTRWWLR